MPPQTQPWRKYLGCWKVARLVLMMMIENTSPFKSWLLKGWCWWWLLKIFVQLYSKADFYSQYIKGSLALRGKEPKKTVAKKGTVVAALKKVFTFSRVMICQFSHSSTLNRRRRLARPQALPRRVCSASSPTLRPAVKRRWSRVQVRATLIAQELVIRTTLHYPWSLGGRCQTCRAFMACDARRCGSL